MRLVVAALVCSALVLSGACRDEEAKPFTPSSSARVPDDEGQVTSVTVNRITLDGKRTYGVSEDLVSFSTVDRVIHPLLGYENQYVHVGVRDDKVYWLAGIAAVVPGEPPSVYYAGTAREVDDKERRVVFADGTVLRLSDGVALPPIGRVVQTRIDARAHRIAGYVG